MVIKLKKCIKFADSLTPGVDEAYIPAGEYIDLVYAVKEAKEIMEGKMKMLPEWWLSKYFPEATHET